MSSAVRAQQGQCRVTAKVIVSKRTKRESDIGRMETVTELRDFRGDGIDRLLIMLVLRYSEHDVS